MAEKAKDPLASIATTQQLRQHRLQIEQDRLQALLTQGQTGQDRGALAAGNALGNLFTQLRTKGPDAKMQQAQRHEQIIQRANEAGDRIDDPFDRQIEIARVAGDEARSSGLWDLATQLDERLVAMQEAKIERGKLKAQATSAEVGARVDEATEAEKIATSAENLRQLKLSDENTWFFPRALEYRSVNEHNQEEVDAARREGAFKASAGVQAAEKEGLGPSKKTKDEFLGASMSAGQFLGELGQLKKLILENPRALTVAGKGLGLLNNLRGQAVNAIRNAGVTSEEIAQDESKAYDTLAKAGITDAKIQSALLGLAYARAKALDPSGRLSNQDVEIAIKMFGASNQGDFRTTLGVLDQLADMSVNRIKTGSRFLAVPPDAGILRALDYEYETYRNIGVPEPVPGAKPKLEDMDPVTDSAGKVIGYIKKRP